MLFLDIKYINTKHEKKNEQQKGNITTTTNTKLERKCHQVTGNIYIQRGDPSKYTTPKSKKKKLLFSTTARWNMGKFYIFSRRRKIMY